MSVAAVRPSPSTALPDEGIGPRRWTREEYYRAAELGLFGPEERLELLDGEIIRNMSAHRSPHAAGVSTVGEILTPLFGAGYHVRSQLPLILNDASEPEPDIVVVPGKGYDYLNRHPAASDALLVVEVSLTTLRYDRGRKRAAYARAGIREYWILNLRDRQLEVYRNPSGSRYRSRVIHRDRDFVTPLAAPQASLAVVDILPPASGF